MSWICYVQNSVCNNSVQLFMRFVLVHEIGIKSLIQEILIIGGLDVLNDVLIK